MTQDVRQALATNFERYETGAQLHDVPPHAVYEVTVDGRRAVCKVARGETAEVGAEAAVVDRVDRTTDLPVPSVLAAGEDCFVATWLDPLHGDEFAVDRDDPDDARALGRGLARLHDATAGQFPRPGFPQLATERGPEHVAAGTADRLAVDAREGVHAVVRGLVTQTREYLSGIGWADPADEVLELLDDRPGLFDGAGAPVLCHGNLHPEHAALRRAGTEAAPAEVEPDGVDQQLAALVDFEHALVAPAEYDYWRTAIPCFHTTDLDPRPTLTAFREGYESVRPLPLGVERRRDAWWAVIFVTFLQALDVQNEGIGRDERERAVGTAGLVSDLVESARERRR